MTRPLAILLAFGVFGVSAATLNVPGDYGTLQAASSAATAGDTVLVQPGVYTGSDCVPAGGVTFRASGAVTNQGFGFSLTHPDITVDGFAFVGGSGLYVAPAATRCTITNCSVTGATGGVFMDLLNSQIGSDLLVTHCRFDMMTGITYVNIQGTNVLVENCTFANGFSCDALRLFGRNGTIRQCYFTNMATLEGQANHPDIMQTFGDRGGGWTMKDFLFERNQIVNCPIQLAQFTMDRESDTNNWGITIRNNLFCNSDMQGSIGVANVKVYNNTWYNCYNSSLQFGWTSYAWPYGGAVTNNAWIGSYSWYGAVASGPDSGALTTAYIGGGGRTGSGWGSLTAGGGVLTVAGTYSGLSGSVSNGTVYVKNNADLYAVDVTNFNAGTYSATIPIGGEFPWWAYNSHQLSFRINTTTFPDGEIGGLMDVYTPNPAMDLAADYNYVSQGGLSEPHGINGGDAKLTGTNYWIADQLRPLTGSVLIDAGATVAGVTNDYDGYSRPRGASYDVGAFEYVALDSLRLKFDFDEGFAGSGFVADMSGYSHDGISFNATNWITATNGVFGTTAGQWTYWGFQNDGQGHNYPASQYIGVTNLAGIQYLTNATISLWAQFDVNGDLQMQLLSAGFTAAYASGGPAQATNGWFLGRDSSENLWFAVYPSDTAKRRIVNWPADCDRVNLNTSTTHLYTVTVDCPNNRAVSYYDGSPYSTNNIGLPWLRVYGTINLPWLAVGTATMDGTPQWGDDLYPNSGYFVGRMDDLRIYDAALSADQVRQLYDPSYVPPTPPPSPTNTMTFTGPWTLTGAGWRIGQ